VLKRRVLQICPHDVMPFGELCARYQQAAAQLGVDVTTVFLSPAHDQPLAHAEYLQCTDLADTKGLRRALHQYASESWDLVLCHRYRSYWAVVRTPLAANHCVVLAHEYGLMDRWQRRLNRTLFAADMTFAGVSTGVAEELMASEPVVLPNVVDVEQARQQLLSQQDALAALGLGPGGFTVGVVGRLHYKKRPTLALQAFQAFAANHSNARLVFSVRAKNGQNWKTRLPLTFTFSAMLSMPRNYSTPLMRCCIQPA
jgi:glycosyltransferase involved in cell wall biosynthesis